jgi:hypothetical protein
MVFFMYGLSRNDKKIEILNERNEQQPTVSGFQFSIFFRRKSTKKQSKKENRVWENGKIRGKFGSAIERQRSTGTPLGWVGG